MIFESVLLDPPARPPDLLEIQDVVDYGLAPRNLRPSSCWLERHFSWQGSQSRSQRVGSESRAGTAFDAYQLGVVSPTVIAAIRRGTTSTCRHHHVHDDAGEPPALHRTGMNHGADYQTTARGVAAMMKYIIACDNGEMCLRAIGLVAHPETIRPHVHFDDSETIADDSKRH
jgi:hypothetical protein